MRKRSGPKGGRKALHLIRRSLASLLLLAAVFVPIVHAQSEPPALSRQRSSDEARPVIVERRTVGDPRPRIELRFGEPGEKCTTWRFETSVQSNGDAVFDLKEPADKKVLLGLENSERHIDLVLGDAQFTAIVPGPVNFKCQGQCLQQERRMALYLMTIESYGSDDGST